MKHLLQLVKDQNDLAGIERVVGNGYEIEKVYTMENSAIFHLTLAEEEDEPPKSEFANVNGFADVPNSEVPILLEKGYIIQTIYQKNTILLKRKEAEKK